MRKMSVEAQVTSNGGKFYVYACPNCDYWTQCHWYSPFMTKMKVCKRCGIEGRQKKYVVY